jgi:hypothetical protein
MKGFDIYFLIFMVSLSGVYASLMAHVGEVIPEHTLPYSTPFLFIILVSVPFLLGYLSGRKSK